jgi:hypothetical protein
LYWRAHVRVDGKVARDHAELASVALRRTLWDSASGSFTVEAEAAEMLAAEGDAAPVDVWQSRLRSRE